MSAVQQLFRRNLGRGSDPVAGSRILAVRFAAAEFQRQERERRAS